MAKPAQLDPALLRALVTEALAEDGARDDCTVEYLGLEGREVRARLYGRQAGVAAGLEVTRTVFEVMDPRIVFESRFADGDSVEPGDEVASVEGPAGSILSAERVALNLLQRLSGIATLTSRFVQAVEGTGTTILDTRKTTPLLRHLERYAVRVGGGKNHRFNLSDMLLVKENHIRTLGGMNQLVARLEGDKPALRLEVEVDSIEFLHLLFGTRVDQIMLDNFTPADVRRAVADLEDFRKGHADFSPAIEVSGGVDLENVREYAVDGVDYISVGALTHSSPSVDFSLEVDVDDAG